MQALAPTGLVVAMALKDKAHVMLFVPALRADDIVQPHLVRTVIGIKVLGAAVHVNEAAIGKW